MCKHIREVSSQKSNSLHRAGLSTALVVISCVSRKTTVNYLIVLKKYKSNVTTILQ